MSTAKTTQDLLDQRLEALTPDQADAILQDFRNRLDHRLDAYLNACVRCGLCVDSCHYYLAEPDPESVPAFKLKLIRDVLRRDRSLTERLLAAFRKRAPSADWVATWVDHLYGRCSMCGRCSLNCSIGIELHRLIRAARSSLVAHLLIPPDLQSTVQTAIDSGNNMGIRKEEWLDTVQWLEEELQGESGDASARMPIDQAGAEFLYTVNPREPKFFPLSLLAAGKIFYAAGASWTLPGDFYDVTNYGLFSGDDAAAAVISERLAESMRRLGAKVLVLGECGHGFNANRWEGPDWIGKKYGFEVRSVLQVVADFIREGRIRLDPNRNPLPVTLHDPCNLVRLGGVVEPQRFILRAAVKEFIEMTPHGIQNFCCGGGGGQLSMSRYAKRRIRAGRIKADQITRTGAKVVATPCHNCIDQLAEINKEYKLGVAVRTVSEIVADALVLADQDEQ